MNQLFSLRIVQIINVALVMGVVLFLIVSYFMLVDQLIPVDETDMPFALIIPLVGILSIVLSYFFRQLRFRQLRSHIEALSKLKAFFRVQIVSLAILDGIALFCAMIGLVYSYQLGFLMALLLVAVMLYYFPTAKRLIKWLDLGIDDNIPK